MTELFDIMLNLGSPMICCYFMGKYIIHQNDLMHEKYEKMNENYVQLNERSIKTIENNNNFIKELNEFLKEDKTCF